MPKRKRMTKISRKFAISGSLKGCQALINIKEVRGARLKPRALRGKKKR